MTALPAEPMHDDPLDPQRILGELPEAERDTFRTEYRRYARAALDPAGWHELHRFLRLWSMRAVAVAQPGYYEARQATRAGTSEGVMLDEAIEQLRADRAAR